MTNCLFSHRIKLERLDMTKEYEKRKASGKDSINLVVVGELHVLFVT